VLQNASYESPYLQLYHTYELLPPIIKTKKIKLNKSIKLGYGTGNYVIYLMSEGFDAYIVIFRIQRSKSQENPHLKKMYHASYCSRCDGRYGCVGKRSTLNAMGSSYLIFSRLTQKNIVRAFTVCLIPRSIIHPSASEKRALNLVTQENMEKRLLIRFCIFPLNVRQRLYLHRVSKLRVKDN